MRKSARSHREKLQELVVIPHGDGKYDVQPRTAPDQQGLQDKSGFLDVFGWITIIMFAIIVFKALVR